MEPTPAPKPEPVPETQKTEPEKPSAPAEEEEGYYDEETGEWISTKEEEGYYDEETGEWISTKGGYYDENGEWIYTDEDGYYDENGEWIPTPKQPKEEEKKPEPMEVAEEPTVDPDKPKTSGMGPRERWWWAYNTIVKVTDKQAVRSSSCSPPIQICSVCHHHSHPYYILYHYIVKAAIVVTFESLISAFVCF